MSLQVWLPLNGENSIIPDISSFKKENNITLTEDTNGWYKIIDSSHTSSRWGVYYDFTVKPGMTYTLQVYSKSTTGIPCSIGIQSFQGGIAWPAARDTNSTSTEKLTKYTWTTSQNDNKARIYLAMNPSSTIANNYVFYKQPRVYEAIHNQGIANVTVTANGSTSFTAGKIGQGLICNGSSFWNINPVTLGSEASICYWAKTSIAGKMPWVIVATASDRLNLWNYNNIYTLNTGDSVNNPFKDDNNNSIAVVIDNEWHHFSVTFGSNMAKLYIDGIYKGKAKTFKSPATTSAKTIRLAGGYNNAHSYDWNGMINDFRIYDNCLSQQQIKKIAQGLIIHYPLNRRGWGQDNLMPNSLTIPVGSANVNTGTWRLAGTSKMQRSRVAISDSPLGPLAYGLQSIGLQTSADASCWGIDNFPKQSGVVYTISAWGRIVGGSSTAAMLGFSLYNVNSLNYDGENGPAKSSDIEYYGSGAANYNYAGGKLKSDGNWTRVWRTFSSTSTSGNIYIGFNTATTGEDVTVQLCGIKLEKGEKATPWCPNILEIQDFYTIMNIDNSLQYDISGYQNNGTRTGTFKYISNTPKYNVSTVYTGSNYIYLNSPPTEIYTIAVWVKWDTIPSGQSVILVDNGSKIGLGLMSTGILCSTSGAGNSYTFSKANLVANTWYHFVVVKTGTTTRKLYINGIEQTATSNTSTWTYSVNQLQLGKRSTTSDGFVGQLSDFRAYATALSAEDVLSLYNNEAHIDQSNEIHGKVR